MSRLFVRRDAIWRTPLVLALMFAAGALIAILTGVAPAWQNHGPEAGLQLVRRAEEPHLYTHLTIFYGLASAVAWFLTFFRVPAVTVNTVRACLLLLLLLMGAQLIYLYVAAG